MKIKDMINSTINLCIMIYLLKLKGLIMGALRRCASCRTLSSTFRSASLISPSLLNYHYILRLPGDTSKPFQTPGLTRLLRVTIVV